MGEFEGEGGERGRWLVVWSVLGGRRPGSAGAGVSARGLGSRGEEVGAGVAVYRRGKTASAQEECSRRGLVVRGSAGAGGEIRRRAQPGGQAGGVMKCER